MVAQVPQNVMFRSHDTMRTCLRALTLMVVAVPVALLISIATISNAQAEQPATYMKRVANELMAAQRSGSASAFAQVMKVHADLPSIGLYSLGSYSGRLSRSDRSSYYSGMVSFIARYAAKESVKYPVSKVVVVGQTKETKRGVYVDTVLTLTSGTTYDVRWWLIRRGSSFKVGDAQVIGFWARDSLKTLFESFITDNGGNPKKLVIALNR